MSKSTSTLTNLGVSIKATVSWTSRQLRTREVARHVATALIAFAVGAIWF